MFDLVKWIAKLIPRDPSNEAGMGPFRLPESARWMDSVFVMHDHYYDVGPENNMRLSDIDWRIFKALTILAEQPEDTIERCHRAYDICRYWPIMRSFGHTLYGRNSK